MDQINPKDPQPVPQSSAGFGNIPNPSERFGNIRNDSEVFGRVPQGSEAFGKLPHASERKENHTLTVREAARMFEAAGVARTERSIVNWCQANAHGIARLDAYFDPNERRYYITPQSIELAIAEEKAKAAKANTSSEPVVNAPNASEAPPPQQSHRQSETASLESDVEEMERQVRDLQINNRAKDMFIEQLQKEREGLVEKIIASSHRIGVLETKLLQLGTGTPTSEDTVR